VLLATEITPSKKARYYFAIKRLSQAMHVLLNLLCPLLLEAVSSGRHVVPLNRQRVPVEEEDESISFKSVYFGSISVGLPEQRFSVVFDTGSGHVILPSQECKSETCVIHNRYKRSASQGAVDVDVDGTVVKPGAARDQITVAFGTGEVTGQFVEDRLCLGSLGGPEAPTSAAAVAAASAAYTQPILLVQSGEAELENGQPNHTGPKTAFAERSVTANSTQEAINCVNIRMVTATEMSEEPFHAFAFDGVLGLGLDSLALAPEFSFFGMMTEQSSLAHPSFGVFLADSDLELSEISFGGHSPDKVSSPLTFAPVASPELGYWQVQIKALRIGNRTLDYCDDGLCHAVVDTGTSLLAVPHDFADELQQELEGPLRDPPRESSRGGIDCRRAEGVPLIFEVEGMSITLEPGDYAREASSSDETGKAACQPTMMPLELPEPLGPKLFIWGEPVLRKYYTVYDWKQKQIGFGLAKHAAQQAAAVTEEAKPPPARGLLFS